MKLYQRSASLKNNRDEKSLKSSRYIKRLKSYRDELPQIPLLPLAKKMPTMLNLIQLFDKVKHYAYNNQSTP